MQTHENTYNQLPEHCWPLDAISGIEEKLCHYTGSSSFDLMRRAGEALFNLLQQHYPATQHCLILCGRGNNGGDGYILAALASSVGIKVTIVDAGGESKTPSEAQQAIAHLPRDNKISQLNQSQSWPLDVDIIVDALCGIGLQHAPRDTYRRLIELANQHIAPVIAVDIPSGLNGMTGQVAGAAIRATLTLTFLTLKPGLLTGQGRAYTGKLYYADLGSSAILDNVPAPIHCLQSGQLQQWLPARSPVAHKGDMGKVVVIGGAKGTAGAIRLAGEAALRSGAGLVRVLTHATNITPLLASCPELMTDELTPETMEDALAWADVIAIGPGLGQTEWGKSALQQVKLSKKPMVWDADALNLLAIDPDKRQNRILTPHPGEAARLLGVSIAQVEADRLESARQLVARFGGIVVLKGAGTVIASEGQPLAIAYVGNAGMASGGMGDVLTGVISALMAQRLSLWQAACTGVVAHGHAADLDAHQHGMRGMLARDVIQQLRISVNPKTYND